jgi:hypothetical protein
VRAVFITLVSALKRRQRGQILQFEAWCVGILGTPGGAVANPFLGPYKDFAEVGLIWEQGVASSNPAAPTNA